MPILGYNTAGASDAGSTSVVYGSVDVTDGIGGNIQRFHAAVKYIAGAGTKIKVGVVNCSQTPNYDPSQQDTVEFAEYAVEVSNDESVDAPSRNLLSANTRYWIGFIVEEAGTEIKFDAGGMDYWRFTGQVYAEWFPGTMPAGAIYGTISWSVWVDYQHPGVLGYDTAGSAGSHGIVGQYRGINNTTDPIGGVIKKFHMSVASVDAVNKNVKMAVANCAQGDGDPSNGSLIEQIEFQVEVGDDEWENAAGSNEVLADTKYYIAFAVPDADTKIKYDAINECWYDWGWPYADVFPNPLDVAHAKGINVYYSLWVDYEAGGPTEVSVSDSGVGAELVGVKGIVGIAESGAGVESTGIKASVGIIDSAIGVDIISLIGTFKKSISDIGSGLETILKAIRIPLRRPKIIGVADFASKLIGAEETGKSRIVDIKDFTSKLIRTEETGKPGIVDGKTPLNPGIVEAE
jgi:hypothetical protein